MKNGNNGMLLVALLERSGREPRPYSGRGMYGARCVGVNVDSADDALAIGLALSAEATDDEREALAKLGAPTSDAMGLGVIVYWRNVPWPK
jgi:hypothetical protein